MKKIKIAQVITRMDWGGSPDIVRILCEKLDPEIYDIRLVSGLTLHPSEKTREFFKRFKDNIFHIARLKRNINIFNDTFALFSLCRLFRKEKFDIVHTHTAKAGMLGRLAAHIAGVPRIVHSPHGHNFYGYFNFFISKIILVLERTISVITNRVVTLTELAKRDYLRFDVAPKENIRVINSGLELADYRKVDVDKGRKRDELGAGQDTILVGMIGRLEPVKGPEYFIEGARLVIDSLSKGHEWQGLKFLIVGDGSLRNILENRCSELGISDKVIFTGWREDIPEILSILDILVLPSLNEAVGRILIEAGASGIPVVAAKVGGVPEIVKDNETGVLVQPKDPDSMAQGIMDLLEDKDKRLRMGEASKKWIDDKFSAETMVKAFSDLYKELRR